MILNEDTIAALATPPGKSALAVLRMTGSGALAVLRKCIPGFNGEIAPRRATLADIKEGEFDIDRAIVLYYRAPHSYTGEDLVEIHCHGGEAISRRALELLLKNGARPAEPGEFTFRAFINGKMDLTQAEAVADLVASESELARRNALAQLNGGLSRFVAEVRDRLLNTLAEVEAEIEFPEDEPFEIDYDSWQRRLSDEKRLIDEMIVRGSLGRVVREGFRVTIAGPPNSGKSTLLNALLGEDRAIVHHTAGTTRDALRESIEIGGIRVWLTDTAGLRDGAGEVEAEGISRARREIETADLVIYLFDLCLGSDREKAVQTIGADFKGDLIVAGNKLDLCEGMEFVPDIRISALRGDGLNQLRKMIADRALKQSPESGLIASRRHLESLEAVSASLERAVEISSFRGETEIMALEIREALVSLGNIIGEGLGEEALNLIFSRFCIGK